VIPSPRVEADPRITPPVPLPRWRKYAAGPPGLLFTAALLAAFVVCVIGPNEVRQQLAYSFVRQPTPYTEIYFLQPEALPTETARPARSQFVFEIHNLEGRPMTYEYVTTRKTAAGVKSFGRGRLQVGAGHRAHKLVKVPPSTETGPFVVSVALLGRPESIDFVGSVAK